MGKQISFNHQKVESKWQKLWEEIGTYTPDIVKAKKAFYNLWMFPYPSAEGLHAGHAFSSTGSDVYGRFMKMKGYDVFQPIGYDAFGIHSENYALSINNHPKDMVARTTKYYEKQLKSLGHGYDWTRTVNTSEVDYYRWTQWLFAQMFKAGLAYRKAAFVNWCPSCKTVLADEQVIAGECERCGHKVETKELEQWFFRITDYADRLLGGLERIDWPEKIKIAQRNWIGRKEGINIEYKVKGRKEKIICWTSRPDTNFGATFIVLSPEHPFAQKLATKENTQKVKQYIKDSQEKTKEEREAEGREKTGVFTGSYAINDLNGKEMPIWISDFVLMEVGSGAVVGVPGHDKRDFEFAKRYKLPIIRVVVGSDNDKSPMTKIEQVQEEEGTMVNSGFLNGMNIAKAIGAMMDHIEKKGWGRKKTSYHLRDWLISRQRYWGPPIPMIYCEKCAQKSKSWFALKGISFKGVLHKDQSDWKHAGWYPEENLPVELPYLKNYQPKGTGRGPLAGHPKFYEVKCPHCGGTARRETDVSDTFLDSSWYFLRYPSVGIAESASPGSSSPAKRDDSATRTRHSAADFAWDPEITKRWLPVNLYFGGAEHAVLHLMYARFVTQVLYDLKHINFPEPFPRFFAHGLVIKDGAKMSKSRGNVVNPDEYIKKYGADTLRLYLMFMGPMDGYPDFRDTGIEGMRRFLERVWDLFVNNKDVILVEEKDSREVFVKMHQTIKKVTEDMEKFQYNTTISAIMEFVNLLREKAVYAESASSGSSSPAKRDDSATRTRHSASSYIRCAEWDEALLVLAQLLAPFAPHLAEEVWVNVLGQKPSVHTSSWPSYTKEIAEKEEVTVAVQVDGKLRATLKLKAQNSKLKAEVVKAAKKEKNVANWLKGKETRKVVFIPGKLVNFVTK